jgi:hypothetical protein
MILDDCGIEGSNPGCSAAESANHRFLSVGAQLPAMCRRGGAVADCCRDCMTLGEIKLVVSTPDGDAAFFVFSEMQVQPPLFAWSHDTRHCRHGFPIRADIGD